MTSSSPNVAKDVSAINTMNRNIAANAESAAQKSPAPSKFIKASGAWSSFESSLKDIAKYASVFSQVEQSMDRCSAMELEAKTLKDNIADLKLAHKVNTQEHREHAIKMEEEKAELEKKLEDERADLTSRADSTLKKQNAAHERDVDGLRKTLETERKKSATLTKALDKENMKVRTVEKDLGLCKEQLKGWERYDSILKDLDEDRFADRLNKLFNNCLAMCRNYFLRDLHEKYFANENRWEKLHGPLNFPVGFPPTNSPAAKHLRMAAAMHVIASQLCHKFFKPCYISESPSADKENGVDKENSTDREISAVKMIEEILAQQFAADTKKERLTRALLLSTYSRERIEDYIKCAAQKASTEVSKKLSPIGGGDDEFRSEVEAFFYKAAELWKEFQLCKKLVEASLTDGGFVDWPWTPLEEPNTKIEASSWETVTLFPRVYAPESNTVIDTVIHYGAILLPSQPTVLAAEQEFAQWKLERKSKALRDANGGPGGKRRLSVHANRVNGVPKADAKKPFLEAQAGPTTLIRGGVVQNGNRGG